MLKYIKMTMFIGLFINMMDVTVATEEYTPRKVTSKPTLEVVDLVATAVKSESVHHDYKAAQEEFTLAFDLVKKALGGGTSIDVGGKLGRGEFIKHSDGSVEEEMYYDAIWPLHKRAANLAHYAANAAKKAKDNLSAAFLYSQAGDLHRGDAPAQIWHLEAARIYAELGDYTNSLNQIDKAGKIASNFYSQRDEYICLLPDIVAFCREQTEKLSSDTDMKVAFAKRAEKFKSDKNYGSSLSERVCNTRFTTSHLTNNTRLPPFTDLYLPTTKLFDDIPSSILTTRPDTDLYLPTTKLFDDIPSSILTTRPEEMLRNLGKFFDHGAGPSPIQQMNVDMLKINADTLQLQKIKVSEDSFQFRFDTKPLFVNLDSFCEPIKEDKKAVE